MTAPVLENRNEQLLDGSPGRPAPSAFNLAYLGPAIFGLAIGLQCMMLALLRFGPIVNPVLPAMTRRGKSLSAPEHDLILYMAGLALSMLLILASMRVWRWLFLQDGEERARSGLARRDAARFSSFLLAVLGIGSMICFLILLNSRYPFAPKTFRTGKGRLPFSIMFLPAAGAILCAAIDLLFGLATPKSPGIQFKPGGKPTRASRLIRAAVELGVCLFIVFCVLVPKSRWPELAGTFFHTDELHHWNFFAFGPALEFIHGKAFGTQFYSQYGIGWPLTFALLCHGSSFTLAHMIGIEITYGCLYYLALYVLLRMLLKSVSWAASGVLLAIMLQLFSGIDVGAIMWNFPSSTVLRHPTDVWFFIALLMHRRSGRIGWIALAGALAGAGILYELDTGVYLPAIFAFYVGLCYFAARPRVKIAKAMGRIALFAISLLLVLGIGLWIGSRGTLLTPALYKGWGEGLEVQAFFGIGLIPIAQIDDTGMLLFLAMLSVYLLTLGWEIARHLSGEGDEEATLLACICAYGLAVLLVFVGRSHPYNLYHASIPFVIVIVALLNRARRWVLPQLPRSSIPTILALGIIIVFWSKPQFRAYPSMEKMIFAKPSPEGVVLRAHPLDFTGLPESYRHEADTLRAVAARMHREASAGNQILVLDDNDTVLYYLSGVAPWSRYASLFHSVMTQKMLGDTQAEILARKPAVIFIRSAIPNQKWWFDDVWAVYQKLLGSHYKLQEHIGMYELWRINVS